MTELKIKDNPYYKGHVGKGELKTYRLEALDERLSEFETDLKAGEACSVGEFIDLQHEIDSFSKEDTSKDGEMLKNLLKQGFHDKEFGLLPRVEALLEAYPEFKKSVEE